MKKFTKADSVALVFDHNNRVSKLYLTNFTFGDYFTRAICFLLIAPILWNAYSMCGCQCYNWAQLHPSMSSEEASISGLRDYTDEAQGPRFSSQERLHTALFTVKSAFILPFQWNVFYDGEALGSEMGSNKAAFCEPSAVEL